jgi:hypothetical protein
MTPGAKMTGKGVDQFPFYHHLKLMLCCSKTVNPTVPKDYRQIAEALFPPDGYPAGQAPSIEAARAFAGILGVGSDYERLLESGDTERLLVSFQNNLDLLIQKTWVEKADESRKEKLQDRVPALIAGIEQGEYRKALEEFGAILEELAYLFFGAQSHKDDFTEYTFRIDTQMGLFWWYGGQLGNPRFLEWAKSADKEHLEAILLLGICYLTNF